MKHHLDYSLYSYMLWVLDNHNDFIKKNEIIKEADIKNIVFLTVSKSFKIYSPIELVLGISTEIPHIASLELDDFYKNKFSNFSGASLYLVSGMCVEIEKILTKKIRNNKSGKFIESNVASIDFHRRKKANIN